MPRDKVKRKLLACSPTAVPAAFPLCRGMQRDADTVMLTVWSVKPRRARVPLSPLSPFFPLFPPFPPFLSADPMIVESPEPLVTTLEHIGRPVKKQGVRQENQGRESWDSRQKRRGNDKRKQSTGLGGTEPGFFLSCFFLFFFSFLVI